MEPGRAQAEFQQVVAVFAQELPRLMPKEACARLDWLRRQALLAGMIPTAVLADGLSSAITRDGGKVPLATWIEALSIAVTCGADDVEAGPLLLATVGVRFAA